MDLLLDINIVIDLCAPRLQRHGQARSVLNRCAEKSGRVWLYAGSVQTLVYNLFKEIKLARPNVSAKVAMQLAQQELADFASDKQWLAAKRVMSLPMGPDLTETEQQSITATLCAASSKTEHHAVNT